MGQSLTACIPLACVWSDTHDACRSECRCYGEHKQQDRQGGVCSMCTAMTSCARHNQISLNIPLLLLQFNVIMTSSGAS